MSDPAPLTEIWRGEILESIHPGHIVVADASGPVFTWGDADLTMLPRSSAKMIQALPLIESGAAHAHGLSPAQLALACASHQGAAIHVGPVTDWLTTLGLDGAALACGPQPPGDEDEGHRLIRAHIAPTRVHNNCSGKHTGFLTLAHHLGAGPDYVEIEHPVQRAARQAFEEVTGAPSPTWAIDGCSAPNFACRLADFAGALAGFATARPGTSRSDAMIALREAMMSHPDLVAGEGKACTELMRAASGRAALKTGAEGVYAAILPDRGLGVAVKVADGATRAAECTIAAVLVALGVLDPDHPATRKRLNAPITNWAGLTTGRIGLAPELSAALKRL